MIGIDLDKSNVIIHETCGHCGQLVYPDDNGKYHALNRFCFGRSELMKICSRCLENMITIQGLRRPQGHPVHGDVRETGEHEPIPSDAQREEA
jgi:hypothetical protein